MVYTYYVIMYYSELWSDARTRHSDGRREIAERKTAKTQQWRAEELAAVWVDSPDPGIKRAHSYLHKQTLYARYTIRARLVNRKSNTMYL